MGSGQNALTAPHPSTVVFDLRGKYPRWDVTDPTVLNNPANYTLPFIADSLQRNDADTLALAYDIEYDFEGGVLQKLRGGARHEPGLRDVGVHHIEKVFRLLVDDFSDLVLARGDHQDVHAPKAVHRRVDDGGAVLFGEASRIQCLG